MLSEFEKLVADMRKKQKLYFRSRNQTALQMAKEAEKKVDDHLMNQASLFHQTEERKEHNDHGTSN